MRDFVLPGPLAAKVLSHILGMRATVERLRRGLIATALAAIVASGASAATAGSSIGEGAANSALIGQARRLVSFQDLVGFDTQPNLEIRLSPDAQLLAAAFNDGVRIIDVRSTNALVDLGHGVLAEWSPDSTQLAFYSARSGEMQLWLWKRGSGQAVQLTHFPGGIDPDPTTRVSGRVRDAFQASWSPDGARIAFASRVRDHGRAASRGATDKGTPLSKPSPLVLTRSTPPEWTTLGVYAHAKYGSGTPESRDGLSLSYRQGVNGFGQLFVVEAAGSRLTQITHGEATRFHPTWSPDGIELAYVEAATMGVPEARETQIRALNFRDGEARTLTSGPDLKSFPRWSPDGSRLSFIQSEHAFGKRQVRVLSRDSLETNSAFTLDRRIQQYDWSHAGDAFLIVYRDGTSAPLGRIGIRSDTVEDLSQRGRNAVVVRSFTQTAHGAIAWVQEDPQHLWKIQYLARGSREAKSLMIAPGAENLALGKVEVVTWRNRNGEMKEGALLLPPGAEPGQRYPLIVDAYTTRSGADWTHPIGGNQAWASLGYAVFRPSPRAPHVWRNPWKSEASSSIGRGLKGWDVAFDDVMSGVDEVVRRGAVDPARMCIFGHSNGGNVATEMVTRTNRFRCAVIVAPAGTNLVRLSVGGGWDPSNINFGRPFEEHVHEYVSLSPVFRLHLVETPVLAAAGDTDGDFLLNAIEIYNRLRARDKEVTLLRYPDQGHVFVGEALKDFFQRSIAFFEAHLASHGTKPGE